MVTSILSGVLALSTFFWGCRGSSVTTTDGPARSVLTEADDGREVRLAVGASAVLRLSSSWAWGELGVAGEAVEAIRVHYESDPGFIEWQLRATRAGRAALTAEGTKRGSGETRRFRLAIAVEGDPAKAGP